jgi:hypothetical protein
MRQFVNNNAVFSAIIIFITLYSLIQYTKHGFFYNVDGSVREFGVGYRNKTIMPVWLLSVILGILSYLVVLYYLAHPQLFR